MVQLLFAALVLVCSVSLGVYSFFNRKTNLVNIVLLTAFSLLVLEYWQAAAASLLFLSITLWKRLPYDEFITLSMFGAVLAAYFLLQLFTVTSPPHMFVIAVLSVVAVCALGVFGIFEDSIRKYLLLSNAIQITFVLLDLAVAKMSGKIAILGTVQIFNYTIAGLAMFLTLGVLMHGRKKISELEGSYYRNKWNDIFCSVASLSLAGIPLLNIFVSEWFLFIVAFSIDPMISVFGIFAALILFIMYFKVVYVLLVGEGRKQHVPTPIPITAINAVLGTACVVFGVLPNLQLWLQTGVF